MIPPERLNTKYKMRFSCVGSGACFLNDTTVYYANIELKNAIVETQFNGARKPYFWMFCEAVTVPNARFIVRPRDNVPVIVRSLGEVYTINIQIMQNYNVPITAGVPGHYVLSFEPVDE